MYRNETATQQIEQAKAKVNPGVSQASMKFVKSTRKPSNNLRSTLKMEKSDTIRYDS